MKTAIITCLVLQVFSLAAQKKKEPLYRISGKVTFSSSYCGGMAPTEEMLQELNKERAYAGKIFYVRRGVVNDAKQAVILKFKADSLGNFSFLLSEGTYSIILPEQLKPLNLNTFKTTNNVSYDIQCLKEWWKKPYSVLQVIDKPVNSLNFSFRKRCFIESDLPCLIYNGPYPP